MVVNQGKFVPVHTMKAHRGSRGISPLVLNFGARSRWVVSLTPHLVCPWEEPQIGVWMGPEPIWMVWRREKSLVPAEICTFDCIACSQATVVTVLPCLFSYS